MEEPKQPRKRRKKYTVKTTIAMEPEQLELLNETADEIGEDRSATIREALNIGVASMQKKHRRAHGSDN